VGKIGSTEHRNGRGVANIGVACELFVMADLLRRGFQVTKPLSAWAKHDMHVKLGSKWYGVQVKAGRLNTKTNFVSLRESKKKLNSPIIAVVYIPHGRIDYRPGTQPLPKELLTELEKSIRELEAWRDSFTSAARAKASRLKEAISTQPKKTTNSAAAVGRV
jgi:hypothetical protein